MIRSLGLTIVGLFFAGVLLAQRSTDFFDLSIGTVSAQTSVSGAYVHHWFVSRNQRFEMGFGGRLTTYTGVNQYYTTAPASIITGGAPFGTPVKANVDSLWTTAHIFALNALISFGYHINDRFALGFNIDVVGYSFGGANSGTYVNGSQVQNTIINPTPFNILLLGNNDRGSLNSEFYIKYKLSDQWYVKAGLQHLFTEYTATTKVQQLPEPNDRFRNTSSLPMIGISLKLK
jgi:hypothetical protein